MSRAGRRPWTAEGEARADAAARRYFPDAVRSYLAAVARGDHDRAGHEWIELVTLVPRDCHDPAPADLAHLGATYAEVWETLYLRNRGMCANPQVSVRNAADGRARHLRHTGPADRRSQAELHRSYPEGSPD